MRKHLIRHLLMLFLSSMLVMVTLIVIPASGDLNEPNPLEALEELTKDISGLPPGTVRTEQKKTLCNKIRAVIHQIEAGAYKGAVNKLGNDFIDAVEGWVYAESARARLIGKAEYIIGLILGLIRPVHDIALVGFHVTPSEVTLGEIVYGNITIINEGTGPEAFDVYVYADATPIETMLNVTLFPGANTTLSFSWDTTGVDEGVYTLSIEVPPVEGEKDVEDNFLDGIVTVSPLLKHDVTVIKVNSPPEVTEGTRVEISVDVANLGDFDETLNVSVTYDAVLIETLILTPLDSGSSATIMFFWDTRGVGPNAYTIMAEAFLDEDENLTNNKASTLITIILGPSPPVASFIISPAEPIINEIAVLDASESYDPDGYIASYFWDFGDGTTGSGVIVNHAYTEYGDYTVKLNATDNEGLWDVDTDTVRVYPRQPKAAFSFVTLELRTNEIGTWDATASYDQDGDIVWYYWSLGDDTNLNATDPVASHSYSDNGVFTIVLIVGDNDGLTDTVSTSITVFNRAPVADFAESTELVNTDETVIFDASESYDPDGYIASYFWDFGDESNGTGKIVNHTYAAPGNYTVELIVTDDDGATSSVSATKMVTTPSGLPLAWFAAIGLGVAALTATLIYALYRSRKKKTVVASNNRGVGSLPTTALYFPPMVLTVVD